MDDILFYQGEALRKALTQTKEDKRVLIEGYMAEKTISMLYANDGIGKSTINLQAMAEAASGLNVFQGMLVDTPLKVIYVLGERDVEEPFERLIAMDNKLHFNFDNLAITDKLQGFNLQNERHHDPCLKILDAIAKACFDRVDIINFDPIYSLCGGKLKEDEDVSILRSFILKVKKEFDCAINQVHHENRGQVRGKKGRTGADFYGNKFLSAMCNNVWHLKVNDDGDGTTLFNEKDSYHIGLKNLPLEYDEESYTSKIYPASSSAHIRMIVHSFLNSCYNAHKMFSLRDLKSLADGVCISTFRKILRTHLDTGKIRNCKPLGQNALYEILERI